MSHRQDFVAGDLISSGSTIPNIEKVKVAQLIKALNNDDTRDRALSGLAEKWKICDDLAPMIWSSSGTIFTLLKVITEAYCVLSTPGISDITHRVCNALALLKSVASHPQTKTSFLKAKIHCYVYPFFTIDNTINDHEYIRVSALGVIGALVKEDDDAHIVQSLIKTQLVSICLLPIEIGSMLSKTVAALILSRILSRKEGLNYVCRLAIRFYLVVRVLKNAVEQLALENRLAEEESRRLLKYVISCFHSLSQNPRACLGLKNCIPSSFKDPDFKKIFRDNLQNLTSLKLKQLFENIKAADECIAPAKPQRIFRS